MRWSPPTMTPPLPYPPLQTMPWQKRGLNTPKFACIANDLVHFQAITFKSVAITIYSSNTLKRTDTFLVADFSAIKASLKWLLLGVTWQTHCLWEGSYDCRAWCEAGNQPPGIRLSYTATQCQVLLKMPIWNTNKWRPGVMLSPINKTHFPASVMQCCFVIRWTGVVMSRPSLRSRHSEACTSHYSCLLFNARSEQCLCCMLGRVLYSQCSFAGNYLIHCK